MNAETQKLFDKIGLKYSVSYTRQRHTTFFQSLAKGQFECEVSFLDNESLEMVSAFLLELANSLTAISFTNRRALQGQFIHFETRSVLHLKGLGMPGLPLKSGVSPMGVVRKLSTVLPHAVLRAPNLKFFSLKGITLKDTAYPNLFKALGKCTHLEGLFFVCCNVGDHGVEALSTHLSRLSLHQLQLCGCGLSSVAATHLANLLERHASRREALSWEYSLRKSHRVHSAQGDREKEKEIAAKAFKASAVSAGLAVLDLSMNCLGDKGLLALARPLASDSWIACVNLRQNSISDEGGRTAAHILKENKNLLRLLYVGVYSESLMFRDHLPADAEGKEKLTRLSTNVTQEGKSEFFSMGKANLLDWETAMVIREKTLSRNEKLLLFDKSLLSPLCNLADSDVAEINQLAPKANEEKKKVIEVVTPPTFGAVDYRPPSARPRSPVVQPKIQVLQGSNVCSPRNKKLSDRERDSLLQKIAGELDKHRQREVDLEPENEDLRRKLDLLALRVEALTGRPGTSAGLASSNDAGVLREQEARQLDQVLTHLEHTFQQLYSLQIGQPAQAKV